MADVPLIPRTRLFGNPSRAQGRLSPDGAWISWLAPRDGVMNIWIAPRADIASAKPLTNERARPIPTYFWAPDSASILFVNDQGGDENFRLFSVAAEGGQTRVLTPFEKTRTQILHVSRQVRDRILIGLNNRDPRWHDVYALNLSDGALTLAFQNDGFTGFVADEALNLRRAARPRADGGLDYCAIENGKAGETPVDTITLEDSAVTGPLHFTADGATLYWFDSRGRDTAAILAEDVKSGAREVIAADPRVDLLAGLFHPLTRRIEAFAATYLKTEWTALDPAVKDDLAFLQGELKGEIAIASRTYANDLWLLSVDPVDQPQAAWLYERGPKRLTQLYLTRPGLAGAALAPMHGREIRARDGLAMASYLTLPPASDPARTGRPTSPVPMVLFPHGGPWGRDVYGYNAYHQFLANRGYAVLAPNFRSSLGFGKAHLVAGNREWATKIQDDLLDAVKWAIDEGIADKDGIAVMGGSFGGYCVLAQLAFHPDVFACGVDIVGPSNLMTLLATMPAYWEAMRVQMYARVGDPTTPEGAALLKAHSPLTKADAIRKPLLIAQGANDPRVKQAESDQIVAAMEAKAIPVAYLLFPDEGHGFARPENNIAFMAAAEHFLAQWIGGRAEPYDAALKPSSLTAPHGARFVPGLEAALAAR